MKISKIITVMGLSALLSTAARAQFTTPPQGRLTLDSAHAVMTSDVSNTSTIYYLPYTGTQVPFATGGGLGSTTYAASQMPSVMTLTLTSVQTAGNIYDIFYYADTLHGGYQIGLGPAWATRTSRGSGAGTTQLQRAASNGILMNAQSFYPTNGVIVTPSLFANNGTYLGSVYITEDGATSMQFKPAPAAGGTANVLGLYNAYNRVRTIARNNDSVYPAWTYSTPSWEILDNSNNNTIEFIDGLQQSSIDAQAQINLFSSTSSVTGFIGVDLDSTTANPGGTQGFASTTQTPYGLPVSSFDHFQPQMGYHYIAAVQYATGSYVTFFNGSGGSEELKVELEM